MAVPQRPQPAQPPSVRSAEPQSKVTPDDLLARDFNVLAKPSNLFRFRIDKDNVVLDFGYLPPIIQDEIQLLNKDVVNVHTRISIDFELAKQMVEKLLETINEAEKM
jgi:hypothetical protein